MRAALLALTLLAAPPKAADPWAAAVDGAMTRDQVVAALGAPPIEFTTFVPKGERPLQIHPTLAPPPAPGDDDYASDDELVLVLEWPGTTRGMSHQVVLKDGSVLYAIAPPLADEADAKSVAKKYGRAKVETGHTVAGDILRDWELARYPEKRRIFVRKPGATKISARVILPPR